MGKVISVVYHSGYGHTARVASAVVKGASETGDTVNLINVDTILDQDWQTLDNSDAIIFGAPTYMGGVSAQFKKFIDASSARWMAKAWRNKIAAGFTNSGSYSGDKLASIQQMMILAMQHGMIWVGAVEPSPQMHGIEVPSINDVNRIGSYSGLMTQSNNDSPDITPPPGDLESARLFGKRVTEIVARFS